MVVNESDQAVLTCNADGVPKPSLLWTKVGGDNAVLSISPIYTISDVSKSHSGEYQCRAYNGIGQHATGQVTLTVQCEF